MSRPVSVGRKLVLTSVLALMLSGAGSGLATKALADASGNASCLGIESSAISPPGSSDEAQGGRAQLAHELKEAGGPPGSIVSIVARVRAGSHEACDQAG